MNVHRLFMRTLALTVMLAMVFTFFQPAYSQCNSAPTAIMCEDAQMPCLAELCMETTNDPFNCCNGWCGVNTAIHNPQYFTFIATEDIVVIDIEVASCNSGTGMQSAILDGCPWDNSNVLACDPGTPAGGTMNLVAEGITIGNTYWLVIDGSAGATCQYIIRAQSGVQTDIPNPDLTLDMVSISDSTFCAGMQNISVQLDTAAITGIFYNVHTTWSYDTFTSPDPVFDLDIPLNAPSGNWAICVWISNGCDESNTICIPVTIDTFETVDLGVTSFCPEAFPFTWGDQEIIEPGSYTASFAGPGGCRIDSTWVVLAYPEVPQGLIDTTVCAYQFNYEGEPYDESGIYDLAYPGQGSNGCDSFAILDLTLHGFEFIIEVGEDENGAFLNPYFTDQLGQFDTIYYGWYTCDTTLISTDENFRPDSSGCYCVQIDAGACSRFSCATYLLEAPAGACDLAGPASCIGNEVVFSYPGDGSHVTSYDWLIQVSPSGAVQHRTGASETLVFAQPGTYHVSLTVTDSTGTFTCTDSIHIDPAFNVDIQEFTDSLQAHPDSALSYTWRSCDETEIYANTSHFLPDSSGCYCVDVVNQNGCTDTDCVAFIISGTEDPDHAVIGIYPNPSSGRWQISLRETVDLPVEWALYDIHGVLAGEGALHQFNGTVYAEGLGSGIYLLRLANTTGHSSMHKLIVK